MPVPLLPRGDRGDLHFGSGSGLRRWRHVSSERSGRLPRAGKRVDWSTFHRHVRRLSINPPFQHNLADTVFDSRQIVRGLETESGYEPESIW